MIITFLLTPAGIGDFKSVMSSSPSYKTNINDCHESNKDKDIIIIKIILI